MTFEIRSASVGDAAVRSELAARLFEQAFARAIAFYRRAGFEVVGVQTFAIGREVQRDYVMTRPLP